MQVERVASLDAVSEKNVHISETHEHSRFLQVVRLSDQRRSGQIGESIYNERIP